MALSDGKIVREIHPIIAAATGRPVRKVIATIVTRPKKES